MKSVIVFLAVCALASMKTEAKVATCPGQTTYSSTMYSICISPGEHSYDLGWAYCHKENGGSNLCNLVQIAELYELGARDTHWGLTNDIKRDARLTPCGDYKGAECYNNNAPERYFPNTPRPYSYDQVYCCKSWK